MCTLRGRVFEIPVIGDRYGIITFWWCWQLYFSCDWLHYDWSIPLEKVAVMTRQEMAAFVGSFFLCLLSARSAFAVTTLSFGFYSFD